VVNAIAHHTPAPEGEPFPSESRSAPETKVSTFHNESQEVKRILHQYF
ncbi:uncharacterized protein METZ01_LOCUS273013, partial [marine metagenome]